MRTARTFTFAAALAVGASLAACDVDQTQEGRMPDVDVSVEEGQLPRYDVDVADVDVGSDVDTILVKHPTVDVKMPNDDDPTGNRENH